MPLDLSRKSVDQLWASHGVARAIGAMETDEPWTLDGRENVERFVDKICVSLSKTEHKKLESALMESIPQVIGFSGHLSSGRALALMRWIADTSPSLSNQLIDYANRSAGEFDSLLVERIVTIERCRILSRVFSPDRMAMVMELLDEILGDQK